MSDTTDTTTTEPTQPSQSNAVDKPEQSAETAIDATTERDRGLLRKAMRDWPRRWRGLTPELKDRFTDDLKLASEAARAATESNPLEAAKVLASVTRTGAMMEAQQQTDDLTLLKLQIDDIQHREGSKVQNNTSVTITVQDATGATKRVGSLRELYANYPAALPAPDSPAHGPVETESSDGGAARG